MRFLVHSRFMDVFVEVLSVQYRGPNYRKIKVRWWNMGFSGKPFCIDYQPQTITIQNKHWKDWKPFDPDQDLHPGRTQLCK